MHSPSLQHRCRPERPSRPPGLRQREAPPTIGWQYLWSALRIQAYLKYTYTNGAPSGTLSYTPPGTLGVQYEFRYLPNNGYTDAVRSAPITVAAGPPPPPTIVTSSLAGGSVQQPYSQTLQVSGGTPALVWTLTSGALPQGLSLSPGGVITGTPSQVGMFSFSVQVKDSDLRVATKTLSITVTQSPYALSISAASVPPGTAISTTWTAPAGSAANDWVAVFVVGTANSTYLKYTYTNGAPSGTLSYTPPGTLGVQYEFRYLPNNGYTDVARSATITVAAGPPPAPVILTSLLANGNLGQPYSQTLLTSGGTTPFLWSITSGALPPGLTLNTSGAIAGTPSQLGVSNFTVRLQDSASRVTTASLLINVTQHPAAPYTLSISAASVPPGTAISTTWTAPAGSGVQDWVSLYRVGNPNTIYGDWRYTNGATSGTFGTTAPATPGDYEFRYLPNNGYTDVTRSATITVR